MKPRTLLLTVATVIFVAGLAFALWREVAREEAQLAGSLSGVVEVAPALYAQGVADIVRTDRLALILVDPVTREAVALKFESPLVPPQTILIGQRDVRDGEALSGKYLLVGITDKDGEVFHVTPGEVYGRTPEPLKLGTEQVRLVLDQPFRGSLFNEVGPAARPQAGAPRPGASAAGPSEGGPLEAGPQRSIRGVVRASPALAGQVATSDRLVILLFDPAQGRPVATRIIPHAFLPQAFSIGLPEGVAVTPGAGYDLRILTDKDDNPFRAAPGEIIGRSREPIPLGTEKLDFVMDTPYQR
ncbi:MAG: hypothetical protein IIA14_06875 [SAR324 cluster bacterium]|nr:hypothetical protein [SAR324 cluster bacterium]